MEDTTTTKYSSKFSSTRGWEVTAKENAEYYIGLDLSQEISSSYTQEYVDETMEQRKPTLQAGFNWYPMVADAYLVCSGQYLENETFFNADGRAVLQQTERHHNLPDDEDSMCRRYVGTAST
ncbi:hypothetical protein LEL_10792 [Akanthomyces lecanii RCEF 1005]|uniref:Uncharacterized protein n=1 Tax=Akanthomyces lecanii RCEF 1005 TaxID=1081108 RepID=A0A167THN8_CORDF|nr:hypothetical protein LEL_10792 [Akanthomyces lecanii RCEF 1005]